MPTKPAVPAFTLGVTSARFEACKRGVAANYAAMVARHEAGSVCVLDADPRSCDVGTRLAVSGTSMHRFAAPKLQGEVEKLDARTLPALEFPPLYVLPAEPAFVDLDYRLSYDAVVSAAREAFDVVVVDMPVGAGRPGPTLDGRLVDRLDGLLLTVTPDRAAVAATLRHLELFAEAHQRGAIAAHVFIAVAITGDEGSSVLDPDDVAEVLGDAWVGNIPQLWGRALPNEGFGPTLGVDFLEEEIDRVHGVLAARRVDRVAAALRAFHR
jgi:MinD-like ATPase involved in chromosome partitioning or flagellar assembly